MFDIQAELKKLPENPGVYLMKNNENIIYVGKAVILKNRVRQYFQKTNKSARIEKMVSLITSFEYIITDSEVEALMLECNLIKLHRPKFNVMLKDDKTYPYIKITNEDFPVIYMTRKILNDKAKYFGPYTDVLQIKNALDYIKKEYMVRQCKTPSKFLMNRDRPCINYQMKKCLAPCCGYISKEEYGKMIKEISSILSGNISDILKRMEADMQIFSENLEFEKAANLRDKMLNVRALIQKQKVSNFSENDIDVIGVHKENDRACLQIFYVRKHKLIGRDNYFFDNVEDISENEIAISFLKQYYSADNEVPNKIMMRYEIEDESIVQFLNEKRDGSVEIKIPKIGEKVRFIEMAESNAKLALDNSNVDIVNDVKLDKLSANLKLAALPKRIECYDISNISGTNIVGGMIVLEDGKFRKGKYRKFSIKDMNDQDDPKCMAQVLDRRFNKALNEQNDAFKPLPDLILIDGGVTQIRAANEVLNQYNVVIDMYGMVKDNNHRTRAFINVENEEIKFDDDEVKNYVTMIQDEVHKYAITYHRKLRSLDMKKSELDNVKGIGEKRKKELLIKFKTIEGIRNASNEDLLSIKGITKEIVDILKNI